ncbi:MAG: TonB-dependent receptor plug domain-containing protein [Gemmatimonadetes bacterium]|nr:TonB-dependent receptor plug domain-containing protein [Gemmatimonadota bacterium]
MRRWWLPFVALTLGASVARAPAQSRMIVGRVADSVTAEPVRAGLVRVLGTPIQAPLRQDGTFIAYVPVREVTLGIESPGFTRREVRVAVPQEAVVVHLQRDVFMLSEVVITGQSTGVERRNLAHSIGQVRGEELSRVPAASVDDALKGKVAGAQITSRGGAPGGGAQLRLRGITSIIGNSDPLFIVDGVIVSNAAIPGGTNAITQAVRGAISSTQENPLNRIADLNPNDIESIEVLKGAAASAMFGSKATNGVIIITTKRGQFRPRLRE